MDKYIEELKNLEQQLLNNYDNLRFIQEQICACVLPKDSSLKEELKQKREFYWQKQIDIDYRVEEIKKIVFSKK